MPAKHQPVNTKLFSILLIAILAFAVFPPSSAQATSFVYFAGAGHDVADTGTETWTNMANVSANDEAYATVTVPSGGRSHYLYADHFGFSIPEDAVISGIKVTVRRIVDGDGTRRIRDYDVRLLKDNVRTGDNRGETALFWYRYVHDIVYGSSVDLWGTTWTPAEINDPDFGVALAVYNSSPDSTRIASIDSIQIEVMYNIIATTLTTSAVSGTYGEWVSLSATLLPAASGKRVAFIVNSGSGCDNAYTDASGVATCSVQLRPNTGFYAAGIFATFAGDGDYAPSSATAALTIDTRPITVTAVTDSKAYDGSTSSTGVPTITSGSLVTRNGDTAAWTQSFDTRNAGAGKTILPTGTIEDGNGGNNYAVTFVNATDGVITALPLTIQAVTASKTYDSTTTAAGAPVLTSGALVDSDSVTWAQVFDTRNVGAGKTITPSGSINDGNGGNNYVITFNAVNDGTIQPMPIHVTADAKTKAYGAADPALTYSATPSLLNGDAFTGGLTRTPGSNAGVYPILSGSLSAGANYTITYVGANLTITRLGQTINVTTHAPAFALDGQSFTVAANSSSGLAVSYSASGACTNAGATFSMTSDTGECLVQYNQAGDTNHTAASQVVETVTAGSAPQVTQEPVDSTIQPGEDATFTALASGNPTPGVQWQFSSDDGVTFSDLPGEKSTSLVFSAPSTDHNGYLYWAVFTNRYGSVHSQAGRLVFSEKIEDYTVYITLVTR